MPQNPQEVSKLEKEWTKRMKFVVEQLSEMRYEFTDNKRGVSVGGRGEESFAYDVNVVDDLKGILRKDEASLKSEGYKKQLNTAQALLAEMTALDTELKKDSRSQQLDEINGYIRESGGKGTILPTMSKDDMDRDLQTYKAAAQKIDVEAILGPKVIGSMKIGGKLPPSFDEMRTDVKLEELLKANKKSGNQPLKPDVVEDINAYLAADRLERLVRSDEIVAERSTAQNTGKSRDELIDRYNVYYDRLMFNKTGSIDKSEAPEVVEGRMAQFKGASEKVDSLIEAGVLPRNFRSMSMDEKSIILVKVDDNKISSNAGEANGLKNDIRAMSALEDIIRYDNSSAKEKPKSLGAPGKEDDFKEIRKKIEEARRKAGGGFMVEDVPDNQPSAPALPSNGNPKQR